MHAWMPATRTSASASSSPAPMHRWLREFGGCCWPMTKPPPPETIQPSLEDFPRMPAPHRIGPYRIVSRLGEGAMGEVYLAEQESPVRRKVGLKILKFGLSTREIVARFELERGCARDAVPSEHRAHLRRRHHAGWAAVLRHGVRRRAAHHALLRRSPAEPRRSPRALPGSVRRRPACASARHHSPRPEALEHPRHGDRRPRGTEDHRLRHRQGDRHHAGRRLGHSRRARARHAGVHESEQAQLSPLDIDARTDVYSLGIVLFELLTGSRPYALTRNVLNPAVLLAEIQSQEPRKPSARAIEDDPAAADRASARRLVPSSLSAALKGDLDWIVLKALEKDRQRRYVSPAELAADLQRHANHEAVLASPPSVTYRRREGSHAVIACRRRSRHALRRGNGLRLPAWPSSLARPRRSAIAPTKRLRLRGESPRSQRDCSSWRAPRSPAPATSPHGSCWISACGRLESLDATERTDVARALRSQQATPTADSANSRRRQKLGQAASNFERTTRARHRSIARR